MMINPKDSNQNNKAPRKISSDDDITITFTYEETVILRTIVNDLLKTVNDVKEKKQDKGLSDEKEQLLINLRAISQKLRIKLHPDWRTNEAERSD